MQPAAFVLLFCLRPPGVRRVSIRTARSWSFAEGGILLIDVIIEFVCLGQEKKRVLQCLVVCCPLRLAWISFSGHFL